jgi:surfactin synthase thioesterase subunit
VDILKNDKDILKIYFCIKRNKSDFSLGVSMQQHNTVVEVELLSSWRQDARHSKFYANGHQFLHDLIRFAIRPVVAFEQKDNPNNRSSSQSNGQRAFDKAEHLVN